MKDLIYYYDKTSRIEYEFGEIQNSFNMSLVIDGTKDSCKIIVYSYVEKEITPNTILWHRATNTWWVVANDKTERYENESGYLFIHNLQIEGAKELLNVRDLTDSGFNNNRYSVGSFIERLFNLSNFEFPINIIHNNNIALDKNVDYLKTFENYTLLSALREFLDGYNCDFKLSFERLQSGANMVIYRANINIISKSGNVNVSPRNADDVFNDIREIRNNNKSSYGTSVISNADNVVSTKTKTYPSVGGVKLSSRENYVNGENAVLRVPSNIFKVNYVDLYPTNVAYGLWYGGNKHDLGTYDSSDESSCQKAYQDLIDAMTVAGWSAETIDDFINTTSWKDLQKIRRRFYYCDNYNPDTKAFISEYTLPMMTFGGANWTLATTSEELGKTLNYTKRAINFQRGNDYLDNFAFFDEESNKKASMIVPSSDMMLYDMGIGYPKVYVGDVIDATGYHGVYQPWYIGDTSYSVNYIPMADIKIKTDNYGDTIDSVLYNQNGKLSDSNALSKVLLSYSKEIESDTITRYGTFYCSYETTNGFSNGGLPSVGDIIKVSNEYYVINNISLDFTPNESDDNSIGYYVKAEVSLSKKVATKSLLTSPNTNIRDYGIPQNNNVKRKQLYRDFYEFDYTESDTSNSENYYLHIDQVMNFGNFVSQYKEHIAVIKVSFDYEINGSTDYYYQLETTTYFMKKSVYEVVDFKDNNIIGYDFKNMWSGFDITKILVGDGSNVNGYNTPISYVDTKGELSSILIKMTTIEYLQNAYNSYTSGTAYEDISIYNASVFIPHDIYDYLNARPKYDFKMEEPYYKKDALEVPVFEYSCQVDDTENVIVGENVLDSGNNDVAYLYSFILIDESLYNDNNYMLLSDYIPNINVDNQNVATHNNAVVFDTTHIRDEGQDTPPYFKIKLYESESIDIDDNVQPTYGNVVPLVASDLSGKTLLVIRHNLTQDDLYTNVVGELVSNSVQASLPTANASNRNKMVVLDDGTYALCVPDPYTFTLSTDAHSNVEYYKIKREGITIVDSSLGQSDSVTENVVQDDTYELNCIADSGYYINGANYRSGTIDNGNVSISITTLKYLIVSISCDSHTQSVVGTIKRGSTTLSSISINSSGSYSYSLVKPNDLLTYTATAMSNYYIPSRIVSNFTITEDTSISIKSYYIVGELALNTAQSSVPTATNARKGKYYVSTSGYYYQCITASPTDGNLYNLTKYNSESSLPNLSNSFNGYQAVAKRSADDTVQVVATVGGALGSNTFKYTIGGSLYSTTVAEAVIRLTYNVDAHHITLDTESVNVYQSDPYSNTKTITFDVPLPNNFDIDYSTSRCVIDNFSFTRSGNSIIVNYDLVSVTGTRGTITFYLKQWIPSSYGNTKEITISGSNSMGEQTYSQPYETYTSWTQVSSRIISTPSEYYLFEYIGGGSWRSVAIMSSYGSNNTFYYSGDDEDYYWNGSDWQNKYAYTWSSGTDASGCAFTYSYSTYYWDNNQLNVGD